MTGLGPVMVVVALPVPRCCWKANPILIPVGRCCCATANDAGIWKESMSSSQSEALFAGAASEFEKGSAPEATVTA